MSTSGEGSAQHGEKEEDVYMPPNQQHGNSTIKEGAPAAPLPHGLISEWQYKVNFLFGGGALGGALGAFSKNKVVTPVLLGALGTSAVFTAAG
tara:strand:+ start:611 stop:889 length:279 start_codon:yes stop_codon:yes gene_type:complete